MRPYRIHAAFTALAALLPVCLAAQSGVPPESPAGDTVLARLTREAVAANPSLMVRRAEARAAAARVRTAAALPNPMLSVGVMDLTLPRLGFRESDFTEVDIEASQDLPWPGTLGARGEAAQATARAQEADVSTGRREIAVQVAELYHRLRYVVTARQTLRSQRALLSAAVDVATTRYATGTAPQGDPLQARTAMARLDTEEAELSAEETALRARLGAVRRVTGPEQLATTLIRPDSVLLLSPPGVVANAGFDSLSWHPRIVARNAALQAAQWTVRAEQLGGRPGFSITTRYGARPLGSDFLSAFVGVRLPIWGGQAPHLLAEAARADADAAQAALMQEQATLQADLQQDIADVTSGETRLRLLVTQVIPTAEATADAALRSYRVGQVPFLGVLAAEDALYRARLDAARVASEYLTHLVMLDQLLLREDAQ